MATERKCSECGAELDSEAPEKLCPRCLLRRGLTTDTTSSYSQLDTIQTPAVEDATLSFLVTTVKGEVRPVVTSAGQKEISASFGTGRVLQDRYVLERELGRGGMGQVYLARDTRLSRHVAIKVMLPTIEGGRDDPKTPTQASLNEAFAEEARLGANLTHPAIAPVFDFGFHEGKPFTVFEYIPGETLQDLLRRRKRLPLEDVRLILAPLAQALDFAHSQHVVHRDLKPANIRATPQGQFKILDLGLAKEFRRQVDWTVFAGTPAYASPEQASGLASDGRTDQYALALIAYEMLTGQRPFQSRDPKELLRMHREQELPSPQVLTPDLPDSVSWALLRAFKKDPNERFATVGEFAAAMGSQFLSMTTPFAEILLEADVESSPKVLLRVVWRLLSSFSDWRFASPMRRLHLVLTSDAVWCDRRAEIVRWPIKSISKISRTGRWKDELIFVTPRTDGTKQQRLWFFTIAECEKWHEQLCSLKESLDSGATEKTPELFQKPIVLLRTQPLMRYQVLGAVESTRYTRWSAQAALRIRGAMLGGDAVVEADEERLPDFRATRRRQSGTAIKAVDQSGLFELRSWWFNERVRKLTALMVWMLTANFLLVLWLARQLNDVFSRAEVFNELFSAGSVMTRSQSDLGAGMESDLVQFFALSHAWTLFLAVVLRVLKWPQLGPAVSLGLLAFGAQLLPLGIGALIAGAGSAAGPRGALYFYVLAALPAGLTAIPVGALLIFQARRVFRQFSTLVPVAEQRSAPFRSNVARLATIASLGVALLLTVHAFNSTRVLTFGVGASVDAGTQVPALIEHLRSMSDRTRERAALALGERGPEAKVALRSLLPLLKDKTAIVRVNASVALVKIGIDGGSVAALIPALRDNDSRVRQNVALALSNLGPEARTAIPALLPLLKDEVAGPRVIGAFALLKIGADKTVIPPLIEALGDREGRVRQNAAAALANLGAEAKAAIPALIPLLKDTLAEARVNAAHALLKIGVDKSVVPPLIEALSDRDGQVRQNAAGTLANLGADAKAAIPALISLLKDTLAEARVNTALALLKIGADETALPALIEALSDTDARVRQNAAGALANIGSDAKAAIPALVPMLKDKITEVRLNAANALLTIGGDKTVVLALAEALRDEDMRVRQIAASTLGRIGRDASNAAPALLELLKDKDTALRSSAANVLFQIGAGKISVPALIESLSDADARVRLNAAYTLGTIGPDATPALPMLNQTLNDKDVHTRVMAALALRKIDPKIQIPLPMLIQALKTEQSAVRQSAVMALGQLGREGNVAVPLLIEALRDTDPRVRGTVCSVLGGLRGDAQSAAPVLSELLTDKDTRVRVEAAVALRRIDPPGTASTPVLIDALGDSDKMVRVQATYHLGYVNSRHEEVIQALTRLQEDKDEGIRKHAGEAIQKVRIYLLLSRKEHTQAARLAEQMADVQPETAGKIYDVACFFARCVPLVRNDEKLAEPDRLAAAKSYADQAVKFLRQAIATGNKNLDHIQRDPDLDAIRDHPGYLELIGKRE